MYSQMALYPLIALALLAVCDGLKEHTGKLLFHSADNDPKDNAMTLIEVQRFFLLFDLNGDGDIKADEFKLAWVQHFQLSEKEAEGMLDMVDQFDPKGEITEIEIATAYNKMDENNDGSVTLKEFLKFWKNLDLDRMPVQRKRSPLIRKLRMYGANEKRRGMN